MAARSWGKGRNKGSQRIFRLHRVFHMIHYWWILATHLSKHIECTSSVNPNVNYRLWVVVMGSLIVINISSWYGILLMEEAVHVRNRIL